MLELTGIEKEIKASVRDFTRGEFDSDAMGTMSKERTFPYELLKKAGEIGLIGAHLPEDLGGGGGSINEQAVILETLAFHDSTAGVALASAALGLEAIWEFGDTAMKERVLPPVCGGHALCTTAFYENHVQTVTMEPSTVAEGEDNHWLVNGTKTNVLNGNRADFFILICQTPSPEDPSRQQPTLFLVDRDAAGLKATDQGPRLGMGMVSAATLHLNNVKVPAAHVIGQAGKGMEHLRAYQCAHWILMAALGLGIAKGAYRKAVDYIKQREQFGKKIAAFRINRHKIARMAVSIELAALAVRRAALAYDTGKRRRPLSALAKLTASETAVQVSDEAIQLLGGYGYMTEYGVERFLRDAKALELMAGEKAVLLDIISEKEIGRL